ncbi:MAG: hypothetical protein ACKO7N_10785 [Candidatus Nitrosotenuis sp.]
MDKYLLIMLIVLTMGMGFSIFKEPPSLEIFYAQLVGAFIIVGYSTYKERKTRKNSKKK